MSDTSWIIKCNWIGDSASVVASFAIFHASTLALPLQQYCYNSGFILYVSGPPTAVSPEPNPYTAWVTPKRPKGNLHQFSCSTLLSRISAKEIQFIWQWRHFFQNDYRKHASVLLHFFHTLSVLLLYVNCEHRDGLVHNTSVQHNFCTSVEKSRIFSSITKSQKNYSTSREIVLTLFVLLKISFLMLVLSKFWVSLMILFLWNASKCVFRHWTDNVRQVVNRSPFRSVNTHNKRTYVPVHRWTLYKF